MLARFRTGLAALSLFALPLGAAVAAPAAAPSSSSESATPQETDDEAPGTPVWVQVVVASMGVLAGAWIAKRQIATWKNR